LVDGQNAALAFPKGVIMAAINKLVMSVALATAVMTGAGVAHASSFMPYQISPADTVNQYWGGSFGQDFNVNSTITITSFGAWQPNGINSSQPLTISIYDRNTQSVVYSQIFTNATPGTPGASSVGFISVNDVLSPGSYSLVGDGFGVVPVGLYNTEGTGLAGTLDNGGGVLTFGGWRYANSSNGYPTITFANSGCCGGDSTFRFAAATFTASTPLPSTWLMLLSGFVGLGFFAYRGTKKNAAALAAA
jgi:hypothetical protein